MNKKYISFLTIVLMISFFIVSVSSVSYSANWPDGGVRASSVSLKAGSSGATTDKGSCDYLKMIMDQFHSAFYVYRDFSSAGNHFAARAKMASNRGEVAVMTMNENCSTQPYSGTSCIQCQFKAEVDNWGGWYFMNGLLQGKDMLAAENWGDSKEAGIDLRGATRLTFWARGEKGGEVVEFFCGGIGRHPDTNAAVKPYPDSLPKQSTGPIRLAKYWQQYTIDLQDSDLKYVLGGFAWVTNAPLNNDKDITFYIDDISYDKQRLEDPRFLVSYETGSSAGKTEALMTNTAYTYDNAVALLAFLSAGEKERAKRIADALVYAQQNDRLYSDGRIRNAYQGGDLMQAPGWVVNGKKGAVRLPIWYDQEKGKWLEDEFQVSTHTGNVAWAMLALMGYYKAAGEDVYLKAVIRMGEWVEKNCRDTRGAKGYTAGISGIEPVEKKLQYKSTEHNIDLYAAFMQIYSLTNNRIWLNRADHAKAFVLAMWDTAEGKFWTGTQNDGITVEKQNIPLDIQAWALLSLKDDWSKYKKSLEYAEKFQKVKGGFDFNNDRDGVWYEGTAQMAAAYQLTGQKAKYKDLLNVLKIARNKNGGMYAASANNLTTGFYLDDGSPWLYYRWLHVGATAWALLAEKGANPFWMYDQDKGKNG